MGVVELAGHLSRTGNRMDIDEAGLPGDLVITVCHGDYDPLVKSDDHLKVWSVRQSVEEPHLVRTWVRKNIPGARRPDLFYQQLASRSRNDLGSRSVAGGL